MHQSVISNVFSGIQRPSGKGPRCIIIGVGNEDGWVEGSTRVWMHTKRDGVTSNDYHHDIDATGFEDWLKEVLPKLAPNSVLVMDNASYHSKKDEENRYKKG